MHLIDHIYSFCVCVCVCVCVCESTFFQLIKTDFLLNIIHLFFNCHFWSVRVWCGENVCGVREADGCSTCSSCEAAGRHHCSCCASARLSRQRRGRAHWSGGVWGETTAGVVRRINLQMRARERERSVCEEARSTFKTCNLSFPSPALRPRLASLSLCSAKIGSSILLILQAEQQ